MQYAAGYPHEGVFDRMEHFAHLVHLVSPRVLPSALSAVYEQEGRGNTIAQNSEFRFQDSEFEANVNEQAGPIPIVSHIPWVTRC